MSAESSRQSCRSVGISYRDILRHWPYTPWSRDLGISRNRLVLVGADVDATPANLQPWVAVVMALFVVLIGIPAATQVSRASASKDPQFVVIDEVAGQLIALSPSRVTWKTLLAGFILFRGFDIVKPPPVRQLERLPEGSGIVLDDVAAGLYALAIMQLLLHFGLLPR